jgi:pimeloyl-ACP methyl ester carboxylesterase
MESRCSCANKGEGPLVMLCHGCLSYSWRHQIPAIAEAGFHVVAPEMRGVGSTSTPDDIDSYTRDFSVTRRSLRPCAR